MAQNWDKIREMARGLHQVIAASGGIGSLSVLIGFCVSYYLGSAIILVATVLLSVILILKVIAYFNVEKAVIAFVNARTWEESKRIVEERQNVLLSRNVLLTNATEEAVANLLTQNKDDEDATAVLEEHRALLGRCRREGIDAAFADRIEELSSLTAPGEMPRRIAVCQEALVLTQNRRSLAKYPCTLFVGRYLE